MPRGRVVITGMGLVTPLGCEVESVWSSLLAGENGIKPVERFEAGTFPTNFAGEVRGYDPGAFVDMTNHEDAGHNTRFALGACAQAWKQARLDQFDGFKPRRAGMYLGSGEGSLDYENFVATNLAGWDADAKAVDHVAWAEAALTHMVAAKETQQEPNASLSHLASQFGCRGPAFNCMTACAASTQAIGEAGEIIRRGDADLMIAGGAHTMIHPLGMTGFIRLTAMSTRTDDPSTAARPFDRTRDGFVMGEGAGIVILEDLDHALARGAEPLAELAGYGSSADAFRITDMHPEGVGPARAMAGALAQAGIDPGGIGDDDRPPVHYISAHGTGTSENDSIETAAIKRLFGDLAPRVPISSVKCMMGHLIQAAGAVELITCVKAIETGHVPPTMNLHEPDPRCDLDYVPNASRDLNDAGGVEVCLSNSFGFGGQNDSLCVTRFVN
jgi:3-oxoacyl-[acyl-carrier-protein] synthase II